MARNGGACRPLRRTCEIRRDKRKGLVLDLPGIPADGVKPEAAECTCS
jgi:hypothetical protein